MKNLKNWLSKNKGAIAAILVFLLSLSELIFEWILGEKTIYFMGFNVVAIVTMVLSMLIAVCTNKFTSATFQEIIDSAKDQYIRDKNNGLTPADRVKIGKKINALEKKKDELKKQNQDIIDNVELYKIASPEEQQKYGVYTGQIAKLNSQIKQLRKTLGEEVDE